MVSWGAWAGGSMRMRVGLEVIRETSIDHNEGSCTITVEYWTENQFTWDDDQSLNLGGAIGGSIGFHNGQGGVATKRGERTYTYTYGPNEYKTNATRTFSASLNGAFNGITPSKSVTISIPDRDFGSPAAPGNVSVSRINDESNKITWNNRSTNGEPWNGVRVERWIFSHSEAYNRVANLGGGADSYSDAGAIPNRRYKYRVESYNGQGDSGWIESESIWTTPATPTGCTRTPSGADQVITWTNNVDYTDYSTQVWHAADGVWDSTPLATVGGATYTHVAPDSAVEHKYRVRAKTTVGPNLFSSYSGTTGGTAGTTAPPSAPTGLAPDGSTVKDPTGQIVLSWIPDGTQTKFEVQHRIAGIPTWTSSGEQTSADSSYSLAADTYSYSQNIEWQVRTWGADPDPSEWSESALFSTRTAVAVKYPVVFDLTSGRLEADSTGSVGGGGIPPISLEASIPAHAHAGRAAGTHTFADATFEALSFDTLISQNGLVTVNVQGSSATVSTFTISETGVYDCAAAVAVESNPTGRRVLRMRLNGTTTVVQQEAAPFDATGGAGQAGPSIAATVMLNAGDEVTFEFYQNRGGTLAAIIRSDMYWGRISKVDVSARPPDEMSTVADSTYYRARADSHRRIAEDALAADGTIPGWVTDRIAVRAGVGPRPLRWVTVAQDGTGNYSTLNAAAAGITDSSARNPIGVLIKRGVYVEHSIPHKDGIWWVGVDRESCIVRGELPATSDDATIDPTSTFDFDFGGALMNLTVTAKNMRYVIHCDAKNNHVNGHILVRNCHLEHFSNDEARAYRDANPGSGMSSSTVWSNERGWGYGSSSGQFVEMEDSTIIGSDPFTVHDFDDWERMGRTNLTNCRTVGWRDTAVLSLSCLGAGHPSIVSFRDCTIQANHIAISDSSFRSKLTENQVADSNDFTLTIGGGWHEPLGLQSTITARALKIESAATTAPSSVAVSGTAATVLFGTPRVRDGGYGLPGYVFGWWDISGRLTGNFGIDQVDNTLGRRLGNCSVVNKTLTVTVDGGSPNSIVFNTNLTAVDNATILATINTALGGAAVASEYNVPANEWFPELLNDIITVPNKGSVGIGRFHAVKRSGRGIDIFGTGDPVGSFLGVTLERCLPGKPVRVLTRGRMQSIASGAQQIPGVTTTVSVGQSIYHNDSTAGRFSTTGTRLAMTGITTNWAEFRGTR